MGVHDSEMHCGVFVYVHVMSGSFYCLSYSDPTPYLHSPLSNPLNFYILPQSPCCVLASAYQREIWPLIFFFLRRRDLFGLTVSEVSVHGWMAPLFWAWVRQTVMAEGHAGVNKAAQLTTVRKKETRTREQDNSSQGHTPKDLLPSTRSISCSFYNLPIVHLAMVPSMD